MPSMLIKAFESGNAEEIANAAEAIRNLVSKVSEERVLKATADPSHGKLKNPDKNSAEYKRGSFLFLYRCRFI